MSSYIGKFLVVVNSHTNLESKKFVQKMAKHLASMQCWIPYQSWLSHIEGQASCPDLSEASEQELSQAVKDRLTCIVGYNVAFVCQWLGGGCSTYSDVLGQVWPGHMDPGVCLWRKHP